MTKRRERDRVAEGAYATAVLALQEAANHLDKAINALHDVPTSAVDRHFTLPYRANGLADASEIATLADAIDRHIARIAAYEVSGTLAPNVKRHYDERSTA